MSITIDLSPELAQELARRAGKHGVSVGDYALDLLAQAAARPAARMPLPAPSAELLQAIQELRDFGKSRSLTLGGMTIREIRHEARP